MKVAGNYKHKDLAAGRWFELSLLQQLANTGAEVGRAINWQKKGNKEESLAAFYRALELINLTFLDPKHPSHRRKEIGRIKELLADFFVGDNRYKTTAQMWEQDFNYYGTCAAWERYEARSKAK